MRVVQLWTPGDNTSRPIPSDRQLQPRPFGNGTSTRSIQRQLRRVRDHGRQRLRPPDALVYVALLRFTVHKRRADVQDPVCYADYFSPMNNGFNPLPVPMWQRTGRTRSPWSVCPSASPALNNHCLGDVAAKTKCTLVMAGFDLSAVPLDPPFSIEKYNGFLLTWFNGALQNFSSNFSSADLQRHFPWSGTPVTWENFRIPPGRKPTPSWDSSQSMQTEPPRPTGCDTHPDRAHHTNPHCTNTGTTRADHFLYPRQCIPRRFGRA